MAGKAGEVSTQKLVLPVFFTIDGRKPTRKDLDKVDRVIGKFVGRKSGKTLRRKQREANQEHLKPYECD
jgi:hypothetical protein